MFLPFPSFPFSIFFFLLNCFLDFYFPFPTLFLLFLLLLLILYQSIQLWEEEGVGKEEEESKEEGV